jgi:alpha-tubulin suppressor-like RCC1 family protein
MPRWFIWILSLALTSGSVACSDGPFTPVSKVWAESDTTCAQTVDGRLWCWGANDQMQLGDGGNKDRSRPTLVVGGPSSVSSVAVGGTDTCAIANQRLWCWGGRSGGTGDILSRQSSAVPVLQSVFTEPVAEVASGDSVRCVADAAGAAWCWGFEDHGSLGNGLNADSAVPTAVTGMESGVVQIVAERSAFYALKDDGSAWGWGPVDGVGLAALFVSDPLSRRYGAKVPLPILGLDGVSIRQISGHEPWTCALDSARRIWCWGNLPTSAGLERHTIDVAVPVDSGAVIVDRLVTGGDMLCVLDASGVVSCAGPNQVGQLGDGTTLDRFDLSVPVVLPRPARSAAAGRSHACAVLDDDTLWCWGANTRGQLGVPGVAIALRPIEVLVRR